MPRNPTEAQIEASRRNGARSLGPATPDGKRISAKNGRRLTVNPRLIAASHAVPGESVNALEALATSFLTKYAPRDEAELGYVNIAVASLWRLQRIWSIDQASMIRAAAKNAESNPDATLINTPDGQWSLPAAQVAEAFKAVHGQSGHTSTIQIAESRYDRQYQRAIRHLDQIKAARQPADEEDDPTTLGGPEENKNRQWEPGN